MQILRSCLDELEAKGILVNHENLSAVQSFATLNHISVESSLVLSTGEADAGVDDGQSLLHLLAEKTEVNECMLIYKPRPYVCCYCVL